MFDFSVFAQPDAWLALLTLTAMEIVLGIDNIVFISILAGRLPRAQQARARTIGLSLALFTRLALLASISWLMGLTDTLFEVFSKGFSGRDLILGIGGLFLIGKASHEIFEAMEMPAGEDLPKRRTAGFAGVIVQILLLDVVFSLDSVITAVGMADHLVVMMVAVVISIGVMLVFARSIGEFIERHPSMKVLALSFLTLIGVMLVAESLGQHVNKGYIYFAMGFALLVDLVNIRMRAAASHRQTQAPQ